ncbi:dicarboxylate/amino acid:cation symporter, partial [Priestia megaterium]
ANMTEMKRLGKIMLGIAVVFIATAAVSAVLGFLGASLYNPLHNGDTSAIKELMGDIENTAEKRTLLTHLGITFTVPAFVQFFSKEHILQLIFFAVLFCIATTTAGEKAQPIAKFLTSGHELSMKAVKIVMYYAPICLGCSFATVVGELGPTILQGYA